MPPYELEVISKIEKWFEVKHSSGSEESRPQVGASFAVLLKIFFSRTAAVGEDGRTHRDRAIWHF